ncbi:hypothetical protein [Baekduia soli]|uniref:hypothetical protein n=1 Tax=Baekduia soli TaxID=496014 RepID=UPI001652049D|nr:hypothetical protein [Baekduia soli]
MIRNLLMLLVTVVVVTAVAELLGAINFGTALTFGQIGFAAVLVWILLRRP